MSVNFIKKSLTVNGSSNGTVTVSSTAGFIVGATVFIDSDTTGPKELVIAEIPSDTTLRVRDPSGLNYTMYDCSAYLTADNATITQSGIEASIPAVGSPTIIPNLIVTNNAQVPTPATDPEAATKSYVDSAIGGVSSDKIYSSLGANSGDKVTKAGSTLADASVNADAKLFSILTGISGIESEKAYFLKDGTLANSGIGFGNFVYNRLNGFLYNSGAADLGIFSANGAIFLGVNLGSGSARCSGNFSVSTGATILATGVINQSGTNSSGTPGNATIDKPTGISSIASGQSSVTITNSLATSTCRVMISWLGDHGQARSWVTRNVGNFVVNLSGAASADTPFAWEISNLI